MLPVQRPWKVDKRNKFQSKTEFKTLFIISFKPVTNSSACSSIDEIDFVSVKKHSCQTSRSDKRD